MNELNLYKDGDILFDVVHGEVFKYVEKENLFDIQLHPNRYRPATPQEIDAKFGGETLV